ncbi:Protein of unknown function [Bacillus mycoides]|uniref:Uncharacterized protein n=1 Tax=Bacillus mycoides TaxID=1405 RepID=A0A1C4CLD2_BACMY|nr:Protein of unknown function [Bacillus mycoides]SCC19871.1 Protein of unknown function [Bacillus mycoides]
MANMTDMNNKSNTKVDGKGDII